MLSRQEIMLIRAALQFWCEEMDLEDVNLLAIYAGDPSANQKWEQGEIQRLRQQLLAARLRYAVCQHDATCLKNPRLFENPADAILEKTDDADQLGVVLVVDPVV